MNAKRMPGRIAPLAGACLLLGLAAASPPGEFYAKQVVDQINVVDPAYALGAPDGRFAEIRPDGEMTVRMADSVRQTDGSDDGRVVVKEDGDFGMAGLFKMTEEGEPAWLPLQPGGSAGGFKLGSTMYNVNQTTDTIRIANSGARSVFVDAVIGFPRSGKTD